MTAAATHPHHEDADVARLSRLQRALVFVGTILAVIVLAVLPLLTPWFIHAALDAADAAGRLGLDPATTHELSGRSVEALLLSGSFDFAGPDGGTFFDASEQGHLSDARRLLWLFLLAGGISIIGIGTLYARTSGSRRADLWHMISRAGAATAVVVVVLGLISVVAFGALFTLFHQVFFPAGNWSFDPATQRLVQLYPFTFWQIAATALAVLVLALSVGAWLLGRHVVRRAAEPGT